MVLITKPLLIRFFSSIQQTETHVKIFKIIRTNEINVNNCAYDFSPTAKINQFRATLH